MAYDLGELGLHAPIRLRVGALAGDPTRRAQVPPRCSACSTRTRWTAPARC